MDRRQGLGFFNLKCGGRNPAGKYRNCC